MGAASIRCPPPGSRGAKHFGRPSKNKSDEQMTRAGAHACISWLMRPFLSFITLMAEKMACLWGRSHPSLTAQWMNRGDQGQRQLQPRNVGTLGKGELLSEHTMTPCKLEDSCETTVCHFRKICAIPRNVIFLRVQKELHIWLVPQAACL